ncbi:MAG TPA: RidA family protein [Hyphomicrobium sp.]|nr:RidA family protein [Hyphomicrobium sp.]
MVIVRQEFRVSGLPEPVSHYTDAVRFGDLLFISGLVALDERSNVVGRDDVVEQARQVFRNMRRVLDSVGSSVADVLKVTVYLTNIGDRGRINPIRQEFFGDIRPASTLVEVSQLVISELMIEVEAIVGLNNTK